MSAHPMISNAVHARIQRKRIEHHVCNKTATEPIIAPVLTKQVIAAVVAEPNAVPTIRKPHHHPHHHAHNNHGAGYTLTVGGLDTTMIDIAQKLFARRILH